MLTIRLLVVVVLVAGCARQSPPAVTTAPSKNLQIYTVNYPLAYFAERIGGDLVDVSFPAPADVDPAEWKPDAAAIAEFQAADVILLNGVGYSKWTQQATLPMSRTIDTTRGLRESGRLIRVSTSVTHQHGPAGDQSEATVAAGTWLDPNFAISQALAIKNVLSGLRPKQAEKFDANFEKLKQDLTLLDKDLAGAFAPVRGRNWLAASPGFEYLRQRHGLTMQRVDSKLSGTPSDEEWTRIESLVEQQAGTLMLWEFQPPPETVERLNSFGVRVVVFRPLSNLPEDGDYMAHMLRNWKRVRDGVSGFGPR